jgi:hypothetical protein
MWGNIADHLASYAGELTQDFREIVSFSEADVKINDEEAEEGFRRPNDSGSVDGVRAPEKSVNRDLVEEDEKLEAYVLDLERSLISKRKEADAALKKV